VAAPDWSAAAPRVCSDLEAAREPGVASAGRVCRVVGTKEVLRSSTLRSTRRERSGRKADSVGVQYCDPATFGEMAGRAGECSVTLGFAVMLVFRHGE
jgi:hypothetical protein